MDLFSMGGGADAPVQALEIPDVPEFTPQELMDMEKQTTGLYLTGHPMDGYRELVSKIGAVPVASILEDAADTDGPHRFQDSQVVTVAGVVSSARTRTTKNNTLMSYVMLEDDTGSMELVAFQRALDSGGAYLKEGTAVYCTGRISIRDEKDPQLTLDTVRPLSDLTITGVHAPPKGKKLWVKLAGRDDPNFKRIELVLTMFPGTEPMVLYFADTGKKLGAHCVIHEALVEELKEMLGDSNVVVK